MGQIPLGVAVEEGLPAVLTQAAEAELKDSDLFQSRERGEDVQAGVVRLALLGQVGAGYLNPDDPSFDRGNCSTNRRHLGNVTVGARTPEFEGAALRALASDWQVSGILTARSGQWLTVTSTQDRAGTGIANQRPDEVLGDVYGDRTLDDYLNRDAFAYAAPGELGDHKVGSIEGPAFWSIDLALAKLERFGILKRSGERLSVVPLDHALRELDARWNGYFDFRRAPEKPPSAVSVA